MWVKREIARERGKRVYVEGEGVEKMNRERKGGGGVKCFQPGIELPSSSPLIQNFQISMQTDIIGKFEARKLGRRKKKS